MELKVCLMFHPTLSKQVDFVYGAASEKEVCSMLTPRHRETSEEVGEEEIEYLGFVQGIRSLLKETVL